MKSLRSYGIRFVCLALLACSIFAPSGPSLALEPNASRNGQVILTVAGTEYQYIPRPDLGYVVKLPVSDQAIESAGGDIGLLANMGTRRVGGLGRRGIWIVEKEQADGVAGPTPQNVQSQALYVAPLFTSDGETLAVIPEIVVRARAQ